MAYLDDHPNPNLAQQRPRRDRASGVVIAHTAESALDVTGPDAGAEGVAAFIARRTDYGSYHVVVDSDSVVQVARFEMTVFGDATGSNDHGIHLSFACRAADWPNMSDARRTAFIRNGARAAADAAEWLARERNITLPARRISRPQSDARMPGFISHAERDPGRRSDPGPAFPWASFLDTYAALTEGDTMNPAQERKLDTLTTAVATLDKKVSELRKVEAQRFKKVIVEQRKAGRSDAEIVAALEALADDA